MIRPPGLSLLNTVIFGGLQLIDKTVKSTTFYVKQDGSISMQVMTSDPLVHTIDDKLIKKFAEINTNAYLNANPYRIG